MLGFHSDLLEREVRAFTGGRLFYWPFFYNEKKASTLFSLLEQKTDWQEGELTLFGKTHKIPRREAWYGDPEAVYAYSGQSLRPKTWFTELKQIKTDIEKLIGTSFNSVLLNYYKNGDDKMGYHADDELELGPEPVIVSLSLGAGRKFVFKSKGHSAEKREFFLASGDLLVMAGKTQENWKHALPPSKRILNARINLTFRTIKKP